MRHIIRGFSALCLVTSALALGGQALAAEPAIPLDKRVDRLEKEVRAVQRKVFPNGAPVEPDITAAAPEATPVAPASTPVSDLIARVTALESQLATQTGQIEQNSYRLKLLEQKFEELKAQAAPPAALSAPAPAPDAAPALSATMPVQPVTPVAKPVAVAAAAPKPAPAAKPTSTKAAPVADEARKIAIAAIERPDTGDAANDAYTYGFRLWSAKFYPEAQAQLKTTVEKYGATSVGSRAQNLLGRAYLDDGKPALASVAFYENYRKRPDGDRTAQSLAYLGEALIQLKKPADACKVYDELQKNYGTALTSDLRTLMEKGRVRAKCGA